MQPTPNVRSASDYGARPYYGELIAVLAAGVAHVTAELVLSTAVARIFNVCAASMFVVYLIWRARTASHVAQTWGLQIATFWPALRLQLVFGIPAAVVLIAWGIRQNLFPPPATFWLALLLYPIWGIVQQFALQNLLVRNLRELIRPRTARSLAGAAFFGLAHVPLTPIVLLTFVSGIFLIWIYERRPNVWAAGFIHGILGAMAYYFVLGRDPGSRIWEFVVC